jgi:hypothetical protein
MSWHQNRRENVPGSVTKPLLTSIRRDSGQQRNLRMDCDGDFWEVERGIAWSLAPDGRRVPNTGVPVDSVNDEFGPLEPALETDVLYRYLDGIDARIREGNL